MRIVFLHHANVCRGGIERMLTDRANVMAERMGHDVTMLTYEQNNAPYPYPVSPKVKCRDLGIKLYTAYKYSHPLRYFKKLSLRRKLSAAIGQFLQETGTEIVVCTDKDSYELQALLNARTTQSLVVEAHTGMIDHLFQVWQTTNIVRRFFAVRDLNKLKETVTNFDGLIALTPDDARQWGPFVKKAVIPNYLSTFPPCPANLSEEHKRVISVGRLNYQKGHDLLLQAWKTVTEKHGDWSLDIFGDGDELPSLNAQLQSLGLQRSVSIHPSTTDIFAEYLRSDFLVCSSRWESFGLIIIEAMACGIPVVSFDCDNGPRNIIADGEDGLLAAKGDPKDLAAKICQMIEQPQRRQEMGAASRKNTHLFSEENVLGQYVNFYEELLNLHYS